jgi:hypothetical protein
LFLISRALTLSVESIKTGITLRPEKGVIVFALKSLQPNNIMLNKAKWLKRINLNDRYN